MLMPSGLVVSISKDTRKTGNEEYRWTTQISTHASFIIRYSILFSFNSYWTSMALATLHKDLAGEPCMFLGTSNRFLDLAHSARQSTVIDPNADGQTTQLQPTCVLSHLWPSAGVGCCSLCLTRLHPMSGLSRGGATMASDPSLPTSECRLSGVGESTMGLGRWSGPCREWSGPRVQGREMWGATHSCWQK